MNKYLKSIERRLNLPKDIKKRVMDDLADSIAQRREAGQTEETIRAELGEPKKVAAELNEQMKEYAYRKSPWRFLFLAAAVLSGGYLLLYRLMLSIGILLNTLTLSFSPNASASIGIIGGADGPTSIFVTGPVTRQGFDWELLLIAILLAVSLIGFFRLRKCKRK